MQSIRQHPWWLPVGFILVAILFTFAGEIIQISFGYGWDGLWYGTWAQNYYKSIFVDKVNVYHVQRILPSAIVHYSMRLLNISLEPQHLINNYHQVSANVITGFKVYNLILYAASAWLWYGCLKEMKVGKWTFILGFVALFVNFALLKDYFYQPVMLDQTAVFLGILILFLYLKKYTWPLLGVTILGAFCWPIILYLGGFLFLFPRQSMEAEPLPTKARWIPAGVMGALALADFMLGYWVYQLPNYWGVIPVSDAYLFLSVPLAIGFILLASVSLLNNKQLYRIKYWMTSINWIRLGVIVLVVVGVKMLQYEISSKEEFYVSDDQSLAHNLFIYLLYVVRHGTERPLGFLLAHIVYFGPFLLLTIFNWKACSKVVRELGLGMVLFIAANLLLGLNSESRQLIFAFPFFVWITLKVIDQLDWQPSHYGVLILLSVLYSKVWFPINRPDMPLDPNRMDVLLEFPLQNLLMNYGLWMNHTMFLVHGIAVSLTAAGLYFLLVRRSSSKPKPALI